MMNLVVEMAAQYNMNVAQFIATWIACNGFYILAGYEIYKLIRKEIKRA
jgi:hypothetical protein